MPRSRARPQLIEVQGPASMDLGTDTKVLSLALIDLGLDSGVWGIASMDLGLRVGDFGLAFVDLGRGTRNLGAGAEFLGLVSVYPRPVLVLMPEGWIQG